MVIDCRLVPGEKLEDAHKEIKQVLDDLKAAHSEADYSYEYEVMGEYPPLLVDDDEPIVRMLLDAYREVTGGETDTFSRPGASDASDIVEGAGVPMPNFAIADAYGECTFPNEKQPIADYLTNIEIYMTLLVKALS